MGFRNAAKKDGNQTQIVRELRAMGFRVDIVHRLKKLYDLVVTGRRTISIADIGVAKIDAVRVQTLRVEVKMPGEKLTADEQEYWDAEPFPETLIIAYETEDVLKWFGRV